jgi:hypothetical protein
MAYTDIKVGLAPNSFDFSGYHGLEHSISDCDDRVKHARLFWSYQGQEAVIGAIIGAPWRWLLCRFGKHWPLPTLDLLLGTYGSVCAWCAVRSD